MTRKQFFAKAGAGNHRPERRRNPAAVTDDVRQEGDEEDSQSSADEEEELGQALADVPFEELQRARADGSVAVPGLRDKDLALKGRRRESKMRPAEFSSKVRPPKLRETIQVPKKVVRDPRFESLCGSFDPTGFRKRYNFLFEEQLPAEKEKLQKEIKKAKNPKAVEELKSHVSWIDKQFKACPGKSKEAQILSNHIKKEREAAKMHGKQPYYLKKSEIRKMKLVDKYDELKKSGKLEAFVEKKRRKNAAKDHRYMPYRRAGDAAQ